MSRFAPLAVALCLLSAPASGQVINEYIVNHSGTDLYEFLEVSGAPSTDYSNLTILEIDGDSPGASGNPGHIDSATPVGTTDADGIWWTGYLGDQFPTNDSLTFLLVDGYNPGSCAGDDLDTNDDGTSDCTPWTGVLDGVGTGWGDDAGDQWYEGATVLLSGFDGVNFPTGGASRIPNGVDTDAIADWTRNDFDGAGLPPGGTVGPNEAANTPGAPNSTSLPPEDPPILSEVAVTSFLSEAYEFVEIFGNPLADYSAYSVVVLEANVGQEPGEIDAVFPCGTTNIAGFWTSGFQANSLENEAQTFLLVEGFSGSVGQDLDTNDDGTLDTTPWTTLVDSVAIDDTNPSSVLYSTATISHPVTRSIPIPFGAARFPWYEDTDTGDDWVIHDDDGAGTDLGGTIGPDESYLTSGLVNRIYTPDYWAGVDTSSSVALFASLHDTIDDHVEHPYSSDSTDTWDILETADEDPLNSSNVLVVYRNDSIAKFGGGNGPYNREHSWPQSYGFPDEQYGPMRSDCHHLFLSDPTWNGARGSRAFGDCDPNEETCNEFTTVANGGVGGGSGVYPGNSNWQSAADFGNGKWEVWHDRRGDIARAQLYMHVRYEGGVHPVTGEAEPDLILTDDTGLIQATTSSPAYMGRLSTLLEWHADDPVDAKELARNDAVQLHQGNRNPFIDHPEWVDVLFGLGAIFADGFESGDTTAWAD